MCHVASGKTALWCFAQKCISIVQCNGRNPEVAASAAKDTPGTTGPASAPNKNTPSSFISGSSNGAPLPCSHLTSPGTTTAAKSNSSINPQSFLTSSFPPASPESGPLLTFTRIIGGVQGFFSKIIVGLGDGGTGGAGRLVGFLQDISVGASGQGGLTSPIGGLGGFQTSLRPSNPFRDAYSKDPLTFGNTVLAELLDSCYWPDQYEPLLARIFQSPGRHPNIVCNERACFA